MRRWLAAVRGLVRIGCLVILTAILWPGVQLWPANFRPEIPQWIQTLESPAAARLSPALSPWIALSALLAAHTLSLAAGLGLAVGLLAVLRRRFFCRWMCPMGVCTELAGRAGRLCRLRAFRLFPVGQWIALLTLAGAAVGYPLLLWMDPLALWAGWITPASLQPILVEQPPNPATAEQTNPAHQTDLAKEDDQAGLGFRPANLNWFAVGAAAVLVVGFLLPGLWCGRFCPLGGLQEVLWQLRQMAVGAAKRGVRAFQPRPAEQPSPPGSLQAPAGQPAESGWKFGRRVVLAGLLGAAWAAWSRRLRADRPKVFRPPGAVDELHFTGLCIRCGNCIRVCPSRILLPDSAQHGLASFLTPVLHLEKDYCREDCNRCTQACPSGALQPLSLAEKPKVQIGLAKVDMGRCLLGEARECFICRDRCPYQAIRTQFSPITYMVEVQIDPARCNGCGACQVACPTWPRAIVVHRF